MASPHQIPLLASHCSRYALEKNESLKVPGNAPAYFNSDPKDDILVIYSFDLLPGVPDKYDKYQSYILVFLLIDRL
jgi:hypothetical protein